MSRGECRGERGECPGERGETRGESVAGRGERAEGRGSERYACSFIFPGLAARAIIRDFQDGMLSTTSYMDEWIKRSQKNWITDLSIEHSILCQFTRLNIQLLFLMSY